MGTNASALIVATFIQLSDENPTSDLILRGILFLPVRVDYMILKKECPNFGSVCIIRYHIAIEPFLLTERARLILMASGVPHTMAHV
jgi:hypothetical protein